MSKITSILFSKVVEEFMLYNQKRRKKQGFDTLTRNFKLHILPYFKDKEVKDITIKDIMNWQNIIAEKNFSNSFNNTLFYNFSTFFDYCVKLSYTSENLVKKAGKFKRKIENKESDCYTLFEFRKFRKHLDNIIYKQYFNFIFFCGTRPSETMALRFCDLKNSYAHICHNLQRRGRRELDTPKNQSSIRYIKVPLLIQFRILILKSYYIKKYRYFDETFFVFGGIKPLSTTTIDRIKESACKKAHIRVITQHQFRHSYATRMIHKGTSIDEVSKNLGHSKVSTTVDVYLHAKKRMPKSTLFELNFFDTLTRNFKNLIVSIITHFV